MSFPRLLAICGALLFGLIFVMALVKGDKDPVVATAPAVIAPTEIVLDVESPKPAPKVVAPLPKSIDKPLVTKVDPAKVPLVTKETPAENIPERAPIVVSNSEVPDVDRMDELFQKSGSPFKFIETLSYKSRVGWQKGRPAWLSDYASHYETSRHFIARSLNGKPDYFKQDIAENDKFNVFKENVKLKFYLLVDSSLCKMWLYAIDDTHNETTLLKTYNVCLGRPDASKQSGLLTPLGKYSLGNRIAIYKPKVMGYHNGKKIEMVRVFGSRWIPFEKEIAMASAPAKGFGIHGVPWTDKPKGELSQDRSSVGKYESDGCIRLSTEDMEEIFSIIITKPTEIEIVRRFQESTLHKK